jgi:hypothetical protein
MERTLVMSIIHWNVVRTSSVPRELDRCPWPDSLALDQRV